MSRSVDNKVVSITFDNARFERAVAQTIVTIENLNKSLQFPNAGAGLQGVSKEMQNVDFNGMANNVENIKNKFSILGAVGFTVIQDLTRSVMNFVQSTASKLIDPIMEGGRSRALNIEQAEFMFEGLGMNIKAAMDDALFAVKGTAYGLDAAAKVAAQFGGAGVEAGEEMKSALRGISGIAAMTGRSYEEIGMVMTGIAGVGRVTGQDLIQFGVRGINVAAKLADQMGKTEQEVRALISDGGMDFRTFAGYMDEAFGEHATKGNQIYTGSVANMRAAMSRLGASIQGPKLENMRRIFNALTPGIDAVHDALKPLINTFNWFSRGAADSLSSWLEGIDFGPFTLGMKIIADAMINVFTLFDRIKNIAILAFREIFPKSETSTFVTLALAIERFSEKLKMGGETAERVRSIFKGVFAVFSIGMEVVKVLGGMFLGLIKSILPAGSGLLSLGSNAGDALSQLKEFLVDGKGIENFFQNIREYIEGAIPPIKEFASKVQSLFGGAFEKVKSAIPIFENFTEKIKSLFGSVSSGDGLPSMGRFSDRVGMLAPIFNFASKAIDWFISRLEGFSDKIRRLKDLAAPVLSAIFDKIKGIAQSIGSMISEGNFNKALDILNIAMAGGIILAINKLRKAFSGGLNINAAFGSFSQLGDTISAAFNQVTATLSAMQAEIRANALLKIASAVGVLAISIIALSFVDSAALTKSLAAISVGFGQLVATMTLLDRSGLGTQAPKLMALAGVMAALGVAMLVLALSMMIMSKMDTDEIAKGLAGVAGGLTVLSLAMKLISGSSGALVRAGISMILMSAALIVLSVAVKAFGNMDWGVMAQGLIGVATGLGVLALGMRVMPDGLALTGLGIMFVAGGLWILSKAVESFGNMNWEVMKQGLMGAAAALGAIALTMNFMPSNLPLTAVGLILVGAALLVIASAISTFGTMDFESMRNGIAAMAAVLAILAIATNAMSGAVAGALSIVIVAGALYILVGVMEQLSQLSVGEILTALGAMAGVFLVLGLAGVGIMYILPGMIALAGVLLAIGAAFLMFGAGAYLAARSFQIFLEAGAAGIDWIKRFIAEVGVQVITMIPMLASALAKGLLVLVKTVLAGLPAVIDGLKTVLLSLLDAIKEIIPPLKEVVSDLIGAIIDILKENVPKLMELGAEVITSFLEGLDENIEEITERVVSIITQFIDTITENMPLIVESAVNLITSFLSALTDRVVDIQAAVTELLVAFINSITENLPLVIEAAGELIIALLQGIAEKIVDIQTAVAEIVAKFIEAFGNNVQLVIDAGKDMIIQLINGIVGAFGEIVTAGANALEWLLAGLSQNISKLLTAGADFISELVSGIGGAVGDVLDAGVEAFGEFVDGLEQNISDLLQTGKDFVLKVMEGIGDSALAITIGAADLLITFLEKLAIVIRNKSAELRNAGKEVASAIMSGLTFGLTDKIGDVVGAITDVAGGIVDGAKSFFGINSPSKVFMGIGASLGEGLAKGIDDDRLASNSSKAMFDRMTKAFDEGLGNLPNLAEIDIQPTITPVLDLTNVKEQAKQLQGLFGPTQLDVSTSTSQARYISHTTSNRDDDESGTRYDGPREVKFEQNIYAPRELSTNDIYRNTKSQIERAKEELGR